MKLAIVGESPVDRIVILTLVKAILGDSIHVEEPHWFQGRGGWSSVLHHVLPSALIQSYYDTVTDGLIVVLDTDETPLHIVNRDRTVSHYWHKDDIKGEPAEYCRFCQLGEKIKAVMKSITRVDGRKPFHTAVGIAIPTLEAWLCFPQNHEISEATWIRSLRTWQDMPYTKSSLKKWVYGTERPSLSHAMACAAVEAECIGKQMDVFLQRFPSGFGLLHHEILSWTNEIP